MRRMIPGRISECAAQGMCGGSGFRLQENSPYLGSPAPINLEIPAPQVAPRHLFYSAVFPLRTAHRCAWGDKGAAHAAAGRRHPRGAPCFPEAQCCLFSLASGSVLHAQCATLSAHLQKPPLAQPTSLQALPRRLSQGDWRRGGAFTPAPVQHGARAGHSEERLSRAKPGLLQCAAPGAAFEKCLETSADPSCCRQNAHWGWL